MPDRRLEPPRAGVQSAGRATSRAGGCCRGPATWRSALCAASSPLLTGCAQAAPATAVPTIAAAPSGGRAPFQIMALKDYAVPPSLQALRVQDAKDRRFRARMAGRT